MKKKDSLIGKSLTDFNNSKTTNRITITALSIAVAFLAWQNTKTHTETIVVPHEFTEEIRVSHNQANEHFKIRWAWSVASLLGNSNHRNAEFVVQNVRQLLSPYLRSELSEMLLQEARMLQVRGVRQSFVIEDAIYDPVKDLVWVIGQRTISAGSRSQNSNRWTYELRIQSRNGRPYITHLNTYEGAPRVNDEYEVTPNPFLSDDLQRAINQTRPGDPIRVPTYEVIEAPQTSEEEK